MRRCCQDICALWHYESYATMSGENKKRKEKFMIKAEKLSYSFPQKDLYNKISFTLEDDVHCAFIGTNGTGKSTLVDMILHPDNYLYDGRLIVDVPGRIGYVSQFYSRDEE